jgi:hypothetical protein
MDDTQQQTHQVPPVSQPVAPMPEKQTVQHQAPGVNPLHQNTAQHGIPQAHKLPVNQHVPTGSMQKEHGPLPTARTLDVLPTVAPAERSLELHPKLQEAGVEAIDRERPTISPAMQQAGVMHASAAAPVITTPTGSVQLPMTEAEAQGVQKTASIYDSIKWRGLFMLRQFKLLHQKVMNKVS